MNRREFLECAALLIAGVTASQAGFSLTSEQTTYLATAPNYVAKTASYLNKAQKATLAMLTETIIPKTDTPGAIDAGVPRFVELMVFEWLNEDEREIFLQGFEGLRSAARQRYQQGFDELPEKTRIQMLEELESTASDSSWYDMGSAVMRSYISDAPFICQIKELTVWGFFTSEIGATQVLRYEPMPMQFDGHRTLKKHDSSWALPFA
ncbi:gluconate 2-dehydrogenase subunit 3 family protein [Spongiibacter sp.]|uniref:gluconate 2-dehydrogenase subunit 3 family protein n=1 Tax=Spongiibacter sp. TaxID=2024860 RepID=UPI003567E5F0